MTKNEEWLNLVRDVERSQSAQRPANMPALKAVGSRRMAVPQVMPEYVVRYTDRVKKEEKTASVLGKSVKVLLIAVILSAGGYAAYTYFAATPPRAVEPDPPPAAAAGSLAQAPSDGTYSGVATMGGSTAYAAGVKRSLENRLRPAGYMETLLAGQKPEWLKISSLELPPNGKPLVVYVIMYASLDDATDQRWQGAGILSNEVSAVTPFVHKVTITKREDLDVLLDWRVEGVLKSLPDKAAKF